jgi:hypothetical protein
LTSVPVTRAPVLWLSKVFLKMVVVAASVGVSLKLASSVVATRAKTATLYLVFHILALPFTLAVCPSACHAAGWPG